MSIRARIMDDLKTAMKAGQSERVTQLRGITAKIKDLDVAARASQMEVDDGAILMTLRSMIKSRNESAALYRQGNRPELAEKEENEIELISSYLPAEPDEETLKAAIEEAVTQTEASSMKDMGRVMGALKERFGASLNPGKTSGLVKARLS